MKVVILLVACWAVLGSVSCLASPAHIDQHADNLQWGPVGHATVASIALALIAPSTMKELKVLLPQQNGDISLIASWADQVKNEKAYAWSGVLHYINTVDWACVYDYDTDCVDAICVDGAIQNYTSRLVDSSISAAQQSEALKFLVHFVGDIHQPLHVGFTTDEGGNTEKGTFLGGKSETLHAIWDTAIIMQRLNDTFDNNQTEYANYLVQEITTGKWKSQSLFWLLCNDTTRPYGACSDDWASESISLACSYSYVEADGKTKITNGFSLENDYYERNWPIIDLQLAKGGVRLANVLDNLFS